MAVLSFSHWRGVWLYFAHSENAAGYITNVGRDTLLKNQGDGTFTECLKEKGLDAEGSKSLGLVIADFNADHLNDVYVASMGVAFGDYDQDGLFDLYCTHFTSDSNTLYHGLPGGAFDDTTRLTGIHKPTLNSLGFGTVMCDFNADGAMDLMVANGHIDSSFASRGDHFEMQAQLFSFNGTTWEEGTSAAGPYFQERRIGRAIAMADCLTTLLRCGESESSVAELLNVS